jgi:hypothetical protein
MEAYFPPTPEQLKTTQGRERAEAKLLKHWPGVRKEIQELQKHLEENKMGITAAQVSMAIQLAEAGFARRAHKRAPGQKRWTDAQLRKMWPQSCGELMGYKRALPLDTALPLGMALVLAQDQFQRLLKKKK